MRSLFLLLPAAALGFVATRKEDPKPIKIPAKPTYAKDVAPILNRSCVSCHQDGEVAPFSLKGYDAAKKWSGMTAAVTKSRQMPPWKAAAGYGEFQHENRLTDEEIAILAKWAETGTPRGDKKAEPTLAKGPVSGWTLGKPDMLLEAKGTYKLDAEGEDVYRNFVIQNPSDKPMWVRAMDVHPGNKKVVHHVIVFVDAAHQGRKLAEKANDGQDGYRSEGGGVGFMPSGALGGWAPGVRPQETGQGKAFLVPAGADLVMQVHYHKSGKPETDKTQVGLYLAKEPIEKEVRLAWIMNFGINIPPNEKVYSATREFKVPTDITLYSVMPHMHLLGKSMRAKLVRPDGREQPLIFVPSWDFNWQLVYALKEPVKAPAGSKVVVDATYDNSTDNPNNPSNPPKRVTWGEETTDEMFLLIAAYTVDSENRTK
ncbi:ascorbate-dependent monooxygenase [bacterium]|nr:MAG: ascorbate-dependent monooxygenase [bacterium]